MIDEGEPDLKKTTQIREKIDLTFKTTVFFDYSSVQNIKTQHSIQESTTALVMFFKIFFTAILGFVAAEPRSYLTWSAVLAATLLTVAPVLTTFAPAPAVLSHKAGYYIHTAYTATVVALNGYIPFGYVSLDRTVVD